MSSSILKSHIVVVDSRDRNRSSYPTPQRYSVDLPEDVYDVVSMRLVNADIPFSAYAVRGCIPVRIGATTSLVPIPPGDHTPQSIVASLQDALNTAALGVSFQVCYPTAIGSDSVVILGDGAFELDFASQPKGSTIARFIGFDESRTYSSSATPPGYSPPSLLVIPFGNIVFAPHRINLEKDTYMVMKVNDADVVHSANNHAHRTFAVIPRRFSDLNVNDDANVYEKRWQTPVARMSKISIEFCDYYGNPYDFQNMDHRLDFIITYVPHRTRC